MEEEQSEASLWTPATNPWRRYGARIIDAYLFGETILGIVGILIGIFGSDWLFYWVTEENQWKQLLVWTPLMWIVAAPVIAACVAWKGATPGKLLFGLRIVGHDGTRSYAAALRREAMLLIWGIGLGIPLLSLAMLVRSYSEVEPAGIAKWDASSGLRVEEAPIKGWRLAGVVVGTAIVLACLLLSLVMRMAARF